MRLTSFISGVVLLSTSAFAADGYIDVSAGEHKDFSRIVIAQGVSADDIVRDGKVIRINGIDPSLRFGFQQINDKQKAFRVSAAHARSNGATNSIEITMRCECDVKTSTLNNGKFILDIYDAKTTPKQQAAAKEPVKTAPIKTASVQEAPKPKPKPAETTVTKEDRLSVEQAHKQMVELLKQAAREGLVNIKDETPGTKKPAQTHAEPTKLIEPSPSVVEEKVAETKPPSPLTPVHEPTTVAAKAAMTDAKCFADAAFLVEAEGFADEPLVKIAELQAELADASSDNVIEIVHKLAHGYLSIGFGEEALSLLSDYKETNTLLTDMARIVAERPLSSSSRLSNATSCDGAHALWQALATESPSASALYQRSNGALSSLPKRLKAMLTARLAMKMIDLGDWPSVQKLADLLSEEEATPSRELDYILARLEQHQSDNDTSRNALLKIANENSATSDEALLALAESYLKNNEKPHAGFTEDIGALARVHPSTKTTLAEAIAWANVGNIDAASMLFERVAETSPSDLPLVRSMAQTAFETAFANEDPLLQLAALDAYLVHQDWLSLESSNQDLRNKIAATARQFGLPNVTVAILKGTVGNDDIDALREKTAAALEAGDTQTAIETAAPYSDDPYFGEAIVNAKLQQHNYHDALASAATLQDDNKRAELTGRSAWLARSWRSVVTGFRALDPNYLTEDAAFHLALASYMARETSVSSAVDAVLSKNKKVLAAGVRNFFKTMPQGTPLQRGKNHVERAREEILMIEEVLSDG
ncbi:MAG: hypothetical protein DHS20C05_01490 [Hyphococcus sp.]|nr:MAG: hypothetical protein DHS20C05_01490 [Marinicaulis sp.]